MVLSDFDAGHTCGRGCKLYKCSLPMPRAQDVTQNTCSYKKKASCQPQCLWNGMSMVLEKAIFWNTGNAMSTGAQAAPPPSAGSFPALLFLTHSSYQPLSISGLPWPLWNHGCVLSSVLMLLPYE